MLQSEPLCARPTTVLPANAFASTNEKTDSSRAWLPSMWTWSCRFEGLQGCCTHAAAGGSTAAMLEDLGAQAQDDQVKHAACRDCHSFCVSQSGAEVDAKVQDALRTSAAALQEQEAGSGWCCWAPERRNWLRARDLPVKRT